MGQHVTLTAADGFTFGGYRAEPSGPPQGALVVIQEIFGVNQHIRNVTDRFAQAGYVSLAPAIFDRQRKDFQSGYTPEEVAEARTFIAKPDLDAMLRDAQAAIDALKSSGPVGVVGFCLGGSLAFLSATRLTGLKASVGYYGGLIAKFADEKTKVPVLLHFGGKDQGIPLSDVETIRQKRPETEIDVYEDAGHAFNRDGNAPYHEASAKLAWQRTLEFFGKTLK